MEIIYWGTRGSIPSPGRDTVVYGGNTPCVEVRLKDKTEIIIDAGSGIRKLGDKLLKEKIKEIHLFITHSHWDHIQGFPFFVFEVFGLIGNDIAFFLYLFKGPGSPFEHVLEAFLDVCEVHEGCSCS